MSSHSQSCSICHTDITKLCVYLVMHHSIYSEPADAYLVQSGKCIAQRFQLQLTAAAHFPGWIYSLVILEQLKQIDTKTQQQFQSRTQAAHNGSHLLGTRQIPWDQQIHSPIAAPFPAKRSQHWLWQCAGRHNVQLCTLTDTLLVIMLGRTCG